MTKLQNQLLCELALKAKNIQSIRELATLLNTRVLPCFEETEDLNQEPAVYLFVHRMMELTGQPSTLGDAQRWRFLECERLCQSVVDVAHGIDNALLRSHDTDFLRAQGVIRDRVRMD